MRNGTQQPKPELAGRVPVSVLVRDRVEDTRCGTCRWRVRDKEGVGRCHFNPPTARLPWAESSVWPPVAEDEVGCSRHEAT